MRKSIFFILTVLSAALSAQVDTIGIQSRLDLDMLDTGLKKYVVYMENVQSNQLLGLAIWERETTKRIVEGKGKIYVKQRWKSQDSSWRKELHSINDGTTFLPEYHFTSSDNGIEAFGFTKSDIVGLDSVKNNSRKDFYLKLELPTYNWELDMEILETLMYDVNKAYVIQFYHPGSKTPPKYHEYKVIGDEGVAVLGSSHDCWKVQIEYSNINNAVFWISKSSNQILRMEEIYGPIKRYKYRIF
ncbi:hypothetical protein BFP97_15745 [Roseivirga sp. 4D4]|uniref:DUF3108 domain-containing protein n=1 Tax=Roseivirga sp. 4D4 TaxID=1889784 RepID=UPI0008532371|nr:hypothetical protein [Roseivirga sp. 4D4]OEK02887.1 hypothetical protein BFP97_15745 [Roseivirga sp. 4D4]